MLRFLKNISGRAFGRSLLAGAAFGGVFAMGAGPQATPQTQPPAAANPGAAAPDPVLAEIFNLAVRRHVSRPDPATLQNMATVEELLNSLDPHSAYHSPEEYAIIMSEQDGNFGGLGMTVEMNPEGTAVRVVSPIDGTPAAVAGLQPGDLITHVDGEPVAGQNLNIAVARIRGAEGTQVGLTVQRGDGPGFDLRLTRTIIEIVSVQGRVIDGGIGYVRVTEFSGDVADQVEEAVRDLSRTMGRSARGYVIDLRNNPGGQLREAIEMSDDFLERGRIVSVGTGSGSDRVHTAGRDDITDRLPIVILTNSGSASASEVVAGALQDHGRAIILGTLTYGKGSVQSFFNLRNGGALRLTTDHYFTPSGDSIQGRGITPDVLYLPQPGEQPARQPEAANENTLANPETGNDNRQSSSTCGAAPAAAPPQPIEAGLQQPDGSPDYQLACAVEILRGAHVYTIRTPITDIAPAVPAGPRP